MKIKSFILIAVIIGAVFYSSNIFACQCVWPQDHFDEIYEQADTIFLGTVESIKKTEEFVDYLNSERPDLSLFHIKLMKTAVSLLPKKILKGKAKEKIIINTQTTGGDCGGFDFEENREYFVFARTDPDGNLYTSTCSGTSKSDSEQAKLLMQLLEKKTSN